VRGLEDTANPYRGQYGEWDYWAYANGRQLTNKDWENLAAGTTGEKQCYLTVGVDKDGYPVPLLQQQREQCERFRDMTKKTDSACVVSFSAFGAIPPELNSRLLAARAEIKGEFVPRIPAWLGKNPPLWALVLPSGDVVTTGELGSGKGLDQEELQMNGVQIATAVTYRYNAQGELQGQTAPGGKWYTLYWQDAEKVLGQYNPNETATWPEAGYVVVRKLSDWSVLATYNYDGKVQPADTDNRGRDWNVWQGYYGNEIALLYEAQR
jgi:YD repeat-containing protein